VDISGSIRARSPSAPQPSIRIELHLEILSGLHQGDEFGRDANEVVVGQRKILVNLKDRASAIAPVEGGSIDDQGPLSRVCCRYRPLSEERPKRIELKVVREA
jgi:hypothetical protein